MVHRAAGGKLLHRLPNAMGCLRARVSIRKADEGYEMRVYSRDKCPQEIDVCQAETVARPVRMTLEELAQATALTRSYLSKLERGVSTPSIGEQHCGSLRPWASR